MQKTAIPLEVARVESEMAVRAAKADHQLLALASEQRRKEIWGIYTEKLVKMIESMEGEVAVERSQWDRHLKDLKSINSELRGELETMRETKTMEAKQALRRVAEQAGKAGVVLKTIGLEWTVGGEVVFVEGKEEEEVSGVLIADWLRKELGDGDVSGVGEQWSGGAFGSLSGMETDAAQEFLEHCPSNP